MLEGRLLSIARLLLLVFWLLCLSLLTFHHFFHADVGDQPRFCFFFCFTLCSVGLSVEAPSSRCCGCWDF
jgi:hypothetical protein